MAIDRPTQLSKKSDCWVGRFPAMASPCEILMYVEEEELASRLLRVAATEAWRIEEKFSRYREDSIVSQINSAEGQATELDPETTQLIDFAFQCYVLSDGMFDISSGIFRRAWPFSNASIEPSPDLIESLLPLVGLEKAQWASPLLTLPARMQIDFGGIGKEYAVDRTMGLLRAISDVPLLVNFGGDLVCNKNPGAPWRIGIEDPEAANAAQQLLELNSGALATSGSTRRYLISKGKRYGHVLNPKTGWPIEGAPLSITVAEENCTRAGMLATFAMLQGEGAEHFLDKQEVKYWVLR